MKKHTYLEDDGMLRRGIDALIKTLGPIETARFLTLAHVRRLDSVKRHRRRRDIFSWPDDWVEIILYV